MEFSYKGKKAFSVIALACLAFSACGKRSGEEDLRGELAAMAGRMAAEKDLRDVRMEDLDRDGTREVILVFGPRELLDFDVFYRTKDGAWQITPMVNDQENPREFVNSHIEALGDVNSDSVAEITVSSRLYDGNTMVKELQWNPTGYKVVSQRTVASGEPAVQKTDEPRVSSTRPRTAPVKDVAESAPEVAAQTRKAEPQKKADPPKPKPKPKPVTPVVPTVGSYQIKKGDTVFGIAEALGVDVDKLESLNNNQLQRRGLKIGQRINVPVPARSNSGIKVKIEKESYTVQRGDTLSSIANRFGITAQAIRSWNPSIPEDGSVQLGQKLNIHHAVLNIT
jgi:LysM repeat protein